MEEDKYSEEFNHEFDDLLDTAKNSFKIMLSGVLKNTAVEHDHVNPKDYGFETEDEMLLKNWNLLDPEDQERLRAIGLNPRSDL